MIVYISFLLWRWIFWTKTKCTIQINVALSLSVCDTYVENWFQTQKLRNPWIFNLDLLGKNRYRFEYLIKQKFCKYNKTYGSVCTCVQFIVLHKTIGVNLILCSRIYTGITLLQKTAPIVFFSLTRFVLIESVFLAISLSKEFSSSSSEAFFLLIYAKNKPVSLHLYRLWIIIYYDILIWVGCGVWFFSSSFFVQLQLFFVW